MDKDKIMSAEEVESLLKEKVPFVGDRSAYNRSVWDASKIMAQRLRKAYKDGYKAAERDYGGDPEDAPELTADQRFQLLEQSFDTKLVAGKLEPQDIAQYKDILNLTQKRRDIAVETVDFSKVFPDEASAMRVAQEVISQKIKDANE